MRERHGDESKFETIHAGNSTIVLSDAMERVGDRWMPLWLEFSHVEPGEPKFSTRVELRDGVPRVVGFSLMADPDSREIMQKDLREADVTAVILALYAGFVVTQDDENKTIWIHLSDGEIDPEIQKHIDGLRTAGKRRIDTPFLSEVAKVYRENVGHAPTKAVQQTYGVSYRQAGNYVDQARKRGLLPPTKQGRSQA